VDVHQYSLCFSLKLVHELEVGRDSGGWTWLGEKDISLGFGGGWRFWSVVLLACWPSLLYFVCQPPAYIDTLGFFGDRVGRFQDLLLAVCDAAYFVFDVTDVLNRKIG
jgi:hypothetical protein